MTVKRSPADVAAVICTRNSISGIRQCLTSLRAAGVGEIVVVDANSTDGTKEQVESLADRVLQDPGIGLGNARNIGIAVTTSPLILNFGSDNVLPEGQLQKMIDYLGVHGCQGVSAQTRIRGTDFISKGLDAWRAGRFPSGPANVIGTPTLFDGQLLRDHPYNPTRRFSDDSELCERWSREFGARFAISDGYVEEIGKTTWDELRVRCRMYGESDDEVFRNGVEGGWSLSRKVQSLAYPARADLLTPVSRLGLKRGAQALPFLTLFTSLRYQGWLSHALKGR